jgi:hypothetical protein
MPKKPSLKTDVFKYITMSTSDVCWEWKQDAPLAGRDSRPTFNYAGRRHLAYRVVYELYHGVELTSEQLIRHKCDNKMCCNPMHLEVGSHAENMKDMRERQRHGLPHHTVKAIKRLLANSIKHEAIAENFGVSRQTITAINNNLIYQHVKLDD